MHGVFYALDRQDFEEKTKFAEEMLERTLLESFLMTKRHLINKALVKIGHFRSNLDKGHDRTPVREICNMMINRGKFIELQVPWHNDDGEETDNDDEEEIYKLYSVLCHKSNEGYLNNIINFAIETLENDDGAILANLRFLAKKKGLVELGLAQRYPENWHIRILRRLSYLGYLHMDSGRIITPKSAFS